MEREELEAWLRLSLSDGIGNFAARRLLGAFGVPTIVFEQSRSSLEQVVSVAQAQALLEVPLLLQETLERTWAWLHSPTEDSVGRQVTVLGDPLYPSALLNLEDPPTLLYMTGQLEVNIRFSPSIAIVGSRNPTPQGQVNARQFAKACVHAGLTVVSGLALGIDGAAHEGALDAASDRAQAWATIAVVGTGLDRVYPKRHHDLAHRVAQHGLIVSEYPLGTPPLAANFPRRNRLIAGLSLGTLVVEAALQSGSLITANLAAEQGKDVFAIPGSIHSPQSHGCHALIRQGAKLVESAQDILDELVLPVSSAFGSLPTAASSLSNAAETGLLELLGHDPVGLDALGSRSGRDAASLQVQLLELELAGDVCRLPGGLFQRVVRS